MRVNKYGQIVFTNADLCDLVMQGTRVDQLFGVVHDCSVDTAALAKVVDADVLASWTPEQPQDTRTVEQFDRDCQSNWLMPDTYKELDIAAHVLSLCRNEQQIQRAGQELLIFQDRNLFDLLRYLKYLVDLMKENNIIWGVGRGSSVSSYVLFLLEVHKIDSLYYNLDPNEFLR